MVRKTVNIQDAIKTLVFCLKISNFIVNEDLTI